MSEEFEVELGMLQGSVLSPFLFIDVVTDLAREGVLSMFLYDDGLILMSETIEALRNMFFKWKEVFESRGLKVNLGKINQLGSKATSVLCLWCDRWIHGGCARVKMVTP